LPFYNCKLHFTAAEIVISCTLKYALLDTMPFQCRLKPNCNGTTQERFKGWFNYGESCGVVVTVLDCQSGFKSRQGQIFDLRFLLHLSL